MYEIFRIRKSRYNIIVIYDLVLFSFRIMYNQHVLSSDNADEPVRTDYGCTSYSRCLIVITNFIFRDIY